MVKVQKSGFKVRLLRLFCINCCRNPQGCQHRNFTCDLQDKRLAKEWFLPLGSRLPDWFTAGQGLFAFLELAQGKCRRLPPAAPGGWVPFACPASFVLLKLACVKHRHWMTFWAAKIASAPSYEHVTGLCIQASQLFTCRIMCYSEPSL